MRSPSSIAICDGGDFGCRLLLQNASFPIDASAHKPITTTSLGLKGKQTRRVRSHDDLSCFPEDQSRHAKTPHAISTPSSPGPFGQTLDGWNIGRVWEMDKTGVGVSANSQIDERADHDDLEQFQSCAQFILEGVSSAQEPEQGLEPDSSQIFNSIMLSTTPLLPPPMSSTALSEGEMQPGDEIPISKDSPVDETQSEDEMEVSNDSSVDETQPGDEVPISTDSSMDETQPGDEVPTSNDSSMDENGTEEVHCVDEPEVSQSLNDNHRKSNQVLPTCHSGEESVPSSGADDADADSQENANCLIRQEDTEAASHASCHHDRSGPGHDSDGLSSVDISDDDDGEDDGEDDADDDDDDAQPSPSCGHHTERSMIPPERSSHGMETYHSKEFEFDDSNTRLAGVSGEEPQQGPGSALDEGILGLTSDVAGFSVPDIEVAESESQESIDGNDDSSQPFSPDDQECGNSILEEETDLRISSITASETPKIEETEGHISETVDLPSDSTLMREEVDTPETEGNCQDPYLDPSAQMASSLNEEAIEGPAMADCPLMGEESHVTQAETAVEDDDNGTLTVDAEQTCSVCPSTGDVQAVNHMPADSAIDAPRGQPDMHSLHELADNSDEEEEDNVVLRSVQTAGNLKASSDWGDVDPRVSVTTEEDFPSISHAAEATHESGPVSYLEEEDSFDDHLLMSGSLSLDEDDDGHVEGLASAMHTEFSKQRTYDGHIDEERLSPLYLERWHKFRNETLTEEGVWKSREEAGWRGDESLEVEGEEDGEPVKGGDYEGEPGRQYVDEDSFSPAVCDHSPSPRQSRSERRSMTNTGERTADDIEEVLDGFLESCQKQSFSEEFPIGEAFQGVGIGVSKDDASDWAKENEEDARLLKDVEICLNFSGEQRGNHRYELNEESCSELDVEDVRLEEEDGGLYSEEADGVDVGDELEERKDDADKKDEEGITISVLQLDREATGEDMEDERSFMHMVDWEGSDFEFYGDGGKKRRRDSQDMYASGKKDWHDYEKEGFSWLSGFLSTRRSLDRIPVRRVRGRFGLLDKDVRGSRSEKELRRSLSRDSARSVPKHRHCNSLDPCALERWDAMCSARIKEEKEGVEAWRNAVRDNIRHHHSNSLDPVVFEQGGRGIVDKKARDRASLFTSSLCEGFAVWPQFKQQLEEMAKYIPGEGRRDGGIGRKMGGKVHENPEKVFNETSDREWTASGHSRMVGGGVDPDDLRRRLEIVAADRRTDTERKVKGDVETDDEDWAANREQENDLDESVTEEWDRLCDELFDDFMGEGCRNWLIEKTVLYSSNNAKEQSDSLIQERSISEGGGGKEAAEWSALHGSMESPWMAASRDDALRSRESSIPTPLSKEVMIRDLSFPVAWGVKLARAGIATLAVIGGLAVIICRKRSVVRSTTVKVARRGE